MSFLKKIIRDRVSRRRLRLELRKLGFEEFSSHPGIYHAIYKITGKSPIITKKLIRDFNKYERSNLSAMDLKSAQKLVYLIGSDLRGCVRKNDFIRSYSEYKRSSLGGIEGFLVYYITNIIMSEIIYTNISALIGTPNFCTLYNVEDYREKLRGVIKDRFYARNSRLRK